MAPGRFATFCYARVDAAARRLVYSNAGHNPPLHIAKNGTLTPLNIGGMVLGVFPDTSYEQSELRLNAGDRLVFYTDGITEARDGEGEEFGDERLMTTAVDARMQPADALKTVLLDAVNSFTGGTFEDDATLIVVGVD